MSSEENREVTAQCKNSEKKILWDKMTFDSNPTYPWELRGAQNFQS